MIDFRGSQFTKDIILWGVRWYVAYPISYRQVEEMMKERGVSADHFTLNRWVIKYALEVEKAFRRRQCLVGWSWRLDETYVKIKRKWVYLYRAVLRSVPSKWRRARDEGQRRKRALLTWTV
jgi:putative transposase